MEPIRIMAFFGGASAWARALVALGARVPLQADWTYGEIAAASGRAVRRLTLMQGAVCIGLVQVIGRGPLWLASRGPVFVPGLPEGARRAALRALARHLPGGLITTPEAPVAGFGLVPLITARHQAIWEIDAPDAELRARLTPKWRNRLSKAERAQQDGVFYLGRDTDPRWLFAAEAEQRAKRGYKALPAHFSQDWAARAPKAHLALCARNAAGQKIAGAVFLRHGAGASYQLAWSGAQGRAAQAHTALLWLAARMLKARGVTRLDLGDVNTEAGAGHMHFKLGTGAKAVALGATTLVLPG